MKSWKIHGALLTSAAITLCLSTAIASTNSLNPKTKIYKISSIISRNGTELSKPTLVTKANEVATIKETGTDGKQILSVEVIADDVSTPILKDGIGVSLRMLYKDGKVEDHKTFRVLLTPGQEGTVSFSDRAGETYNMKITAVRE